MLLSETLPQFPWDTLSAAKAKAQSHPDGIVDLSIGTPADPVPQVVLDALADAGARWHGYPTVQGTPRLQEAITGYLSRRWNSVPLTEANVLPVMGTKELVAWLPIQAGVQPGQTVVIPEIAYPTYEVGALLAKAEVVRCDDPDNLSEAPSLIWLNTPANPHGAITSADLLRRWVAYARETGALLVSDECYGEFAWDAKSFSLLDPEINGGSLASLLACFSLSKRSNMAGYRAGFVAGCPRIIKELLAIRKHAGAMVAGPVQEAMAAALDDDEHVSIQRDRYIRRRNKLSEALQNAGFQIDHSEGSLYLWATRGIPARETVDWLAQRGILTAPGDFYNEPDPTHVRISLTALDDRIEAACERLS